ncbi:10067_t:CDS:1, partial [Cetraspora pellucida]
KLKKNNNNILEKINNNTDFDNLEDIKYAKVVNKIDDFMSSNDIIIDADLELVILIM